MPDAGAGAVTSVSDGCFETRYSQPVTIQEISATFRRDTTRISMGICSELTRALKRKIGLDTPATDALVKRIQLTRHSCARLQRVVSVRMLHLLSSGTTIVACCWKTHRSSDAEFRCRRHLTSRITIGGCGRQEVDVQCRSTSSSLYGSRHLSIELWKAISFQCSEK
jgi:hypothetical protein